jgi:hypothetical protein
VAIAIGLLVTAVVLLQLALKDAAERAWRLVPVLIFAGGAAAWPYGGSVYGGDLGRGQRLGAKPGDE